jgi:dihydroorotase
MTKSYDLILKGGTVVNHDGIGIRDIAIADGRIAAIGDIPGLPAERVIACGGLVILPGVIDTHVHFREPGHPDKEDMESGSRGAVLGGVTAVFEMPNTDPLTVTAAALADKVARAHHRMHCDFSFFAGATHTNVGELGAIERLPGCAGIKVLMGSSTGSLLVEDDASVREILRGIRRRPSFHSEDEYRLRERRGERIEGDVGSHPIWRDAQSALLCTKRLIALARETGKRVHVVHVTTAQEMEFLQDHKDVASIEVTPHHLTLAAPDCYQRLGAFAQINPPIRDAAHRAALWQGLSAGMVDLLGSDHGPHLREEKALPYPKSPSGITGVQTLVPIMLDHVNAGRLSLLRFVDLTSAGPARVFGIARKGRVAVGYDADLTVIDLQCRRTITNRWIASRVGWTPYDGVTVTGWPVGTFVRGAKVMWEGELITPAQGEAVRFLETMPSAK